MLSTRLFPFAFLLLRLNSTAAAGSRRGSGGCGLGSGTRGAVAAVSSCEEAPRSGARDGGGRAAPGPIWGGYEAGKDAAIAEEMVNREKIHMVMKLMYSLPDE